MLVNYNVSCFDSTRILINSARLTERYIFGLRQNFGREVKIFELKKYVKLISKVFNALIEAIRDQESSFELCLFKQLLPTNSDCKLTLSGSVNAGNLTCFFRKLWNHLTTDQIQNSGKNEQLHHCKFSKTCDFTFVHCYNEVCCTKKYE